jgi:mitochondrial splicing suppressor protein 51
LDLAEKRNGILPTWRSKSKRAEGAIKATGGSDWADISCDVEKSDIQEHYGDGMMSVTLRILGEKIYGKGLM